MVALGASFRGRVWEGTSEENGTITKAPRGEEAAIQAAPITGTSSTREPIPSRIERTSEKSGALGSM